jgi:hypothetical protein
MVSSLSLPRQAHPFILLFYKFKLHFRNGPCAWIGGKWREPARCIVSIIYMISMVQEIGEDHVIGLAENGGNLPAVLYLLYIISMVQEIGEDHVIGLVENGGSLPGLLDLLFI